MTFPRWPKGQRLRRTLELFVLVAYSITFAGLSLWGARLPYDTGLRIAASSFAVCLWAFGLYVLDTLGRRQPPE